MSGTVTCGAVPLSAFGSLVALCDRCPRLAGSRASPVSASPVSGSPASPVWPSCPRPNPGFRAWPVSGLLRRPPRRAWPVSGLPGVRVAVPRRAVRLTCLRPPSLGVALVSVSLSCPPLRACAVSALPWSPILASLRASPVTALGAASWVQPRHLSTRTRIRTELAQMTRDGF
jgi:hypothetical protein